MSVLGVGRTDVSVRRLEACDEHSYTPVSVSGVGRTDVSVGRLEACDEQEMLQRQSQGAMELTSVSEQTIGSVRDYSQ